MARKKLHITRLPGYDYGERPEYWDTEALLKTPWINIAGTARRRAIRELIESGEIDVLDPGDLEELLPHEDRRAAGMIDPALMGGEYLPRSAQGEVEIARIEMASVTADVISIRARPWKGRIRYRIVDEYGTRLPRYFASSDLPLTLWELIEQIEGSEYPEYCRGLVLGAMDAGVKEGSDPKTMATFYEVSSDFYDQLSDWYEWAIREWYGQFGDWEADIGEEEDW